MKENNLCTKNGHGKIVKLADFEPKVESVTEYFNMEGEQTECVFDISFYKKGELICRKSIVASELDNVDYSKLSYNMQKRWRQECCQIWQIWKTIPGIESPIVGA